MVEGYLGINLVMGHYCININCYSTILPRIDVAVLLIARRAGTGWRGMEAGCEGHSRSRACSSQNNAAGDGGLVCCILPQLRKPQGLGKQALPHINSWPDFM